MQRFGKNILNATDIFVKTPLSIGFVNLKPILPGHVLVSPKRVVPRLADMTKDEVTDLFQAVHRIGPVIEKVYKGTALTVALQDGNAAGQSVEHVHVHLIPRRPGDFARNDDIYEQVPALKSHYMFNFYRYMHGIRLKMQTGSQELLKKWLKRLPH